MKLRPLRGRLTMLSGVTTPPMTPFWVSSITPRAVTCTCSVTSPTWSAKSTRAICPNRKVIGELFSDRKPACRTSTTYSPGDFTSAGGTAGDVVAGSGRRLSHRHGGPGYDRSGGIRDVTENAGIDRLRPQTDA